MGNYELARDQRKAAFQDWQGARQMAAETKWEAVNHLDRYLEQFARNLEARGTKVHWASTAQQARDVILGILREKKAKVIVKSKAMTSRGDSPQRGAGAGRLRGGRVRPGRVHRPASRGAALSHRLPGDAPDARGDQGRVPAQARTTRPPTTPRS